MDGARWGSLLVVVLAACLVAAAPAAADAGPLRLADAPAGWVRSDDPPAPGTGLCGARPATRPSVVRQSRYEDPAGPAALLSTWRAFATPRKARGWMDEARRIVRACPSYTVSRSDGTPVAVTVAAAAFPRLGEESFAFLRTYDFGADPDPGAYTIVARVKRRVTSMTIIDRVIPSPELALLLARRSVRRA
jgi:hypothetical protein